MNKLIGLSLLLLLGSCSTEIRTNAKSSKTKLTGRIDYPSDTTADFYWSGTSATIRFVGSEVSATLQDEQGDNYYNVIFDNEVIHVLRPDTTVREYELISGISDGKEHTLTLFKRTEWNRGKTTFHGFKVAGSPARIEPVPHNERKIEFFGNSITAGYAIENYTGGDSPDSTYTNHYNTYAALTARHFNADWHCTCRSGIGIMVSWFPLIMPEMYNRLIPEDPDSRWDFNSFQPDVVVINLFQNDSWIVNLPDTDYFKERFASKPTDSTIVDAYAQFLKSIREVYPKAYIIAALGSMDATKKDSPWPGYITEAVARQEDEKIHTLFMPFTAGDGHPRESHNADMAEQLIKLIEHKVGWQPLE